MVKLGGYGTKIEFSLNESENEILIRQAKSSLNSPHICSFSMHFNSYLNIPENCPVCLESIKKSDDNHYSAHANINLTQLDVTPVVTMGLNFSVPLCNKCHRARKNVQKNKENLKKAYPEVVKYEEKIGDITEISVGLVGILVGLIAGFRSGIVVGILSFIISLYIASEIIGRFIDFISKLKGRFPERSKEYNEKLAKIDHVKNFVENIWIGNEHLSSIDTPIIGSKKVGDAVQEYLENNNRYIIDFKGNPEYVRLFRKANSQD